MDSEAKYFLETYKHIVTVQAWVLAANESLMRRAYIHDLSKLEEPEASGFRAMTADARLKDLTYGSEEYKAVLREHKPTVDHHYANNDHHPEHFEDGVDGVGLLARMSLLQLLEMLCDWKASTSRMKDGDLMRSIDVNAKRFGYGPELQMILENTARELGMVP
jgi:hypothetical protein